jgi:hypothetical protein
MVENYASYCITFLQFQEYFMLFGTLDTEVITRVNLGETAIISEYKNIASILLKIVKSGFMYKSQQI